jgi:hypothetical protein
MVIVAVMVAAVAMDIEDKMVKMREISGLDFPLMNPIKLYMWI